MVILKMSCYAPLDFWGKVSKNSVFKNGRHRFHTNMKFSFVELFDKHKVIFYICFYHKHILNPEIQDDDRK